MDQNLQRSAKNCSRGVSDRAIELNGVAAMSTESSVVV